MAHRSTKRISQKELHLALQQQASPWDEDVTGNVHNDPAHRNTAIGEADMTFNVIGRWGHPS